MTNSQTANDIHAYIATLHLEVFGKYIYAYSLLVHSSEGQSWHWGVKNNEHQIIDMEMYGLRRFLLAMADQDPDHRMKPHVFTRGAYLEPRLIMAGKTKRDIDRGVKKEPLWNHDAWIETAILWDLYRGGMREAATEIEKGYLTEADEKIRKLYRSISSPLKTYTPFLESPDTIVLPE